MNQREREELERSAKDRVGYAEAENKESYMVGINVGISMTEHHYEAKIKNLEKELLQYKEATKEYREDLQTLASIINKYSPND